MDFFNFFALKIEDGQEDASVPVRIRNVCLGL